MKKIILLEILLTVAIIVLVILLGVGIYAFIYLQHSVEIIWFATVVHTVLISALFLARRALSSFITQGYFNKRSASSLKYAGCLFIFFSVFCIVWDCIFTNISRDNIVDFVMYSMLIMFGLGLTIIADIVRKGEDIEQENKLTI